jgi:hypothetical protein
VSKTAERWARMRPRPLGVDALARALGLSPADPRLSSKLARRLDLDRGWVLRCRRFGLTSRQADRWAIRAGLHPDDVWPDWWEIGPEDFDGPDPSALDDASGEAE